MNEEYECIYFWAENKEPVKQSIEYKTINWNVLIDSEIFKGFEIQWHEII